MFKKKSKDNAGAIEYSLAQKLTATHIRLLITVMLGCVGWTMFWGGIAGSMDSGWYFLVMLVGMLVAPGPILQRMKQSGGLMGALQVNEYYTVTTYSDGRKTTEYDMASSWGDIMLKAAMWLVLIFVGGVITIIYTIWLSVKYFVQYSKVDEKPPFWNSGFPVMIFCLIFIVLGMLLPLIVFQNIENGTIKLLLFVVLLGAEIGTFLKFKAIEPSIELSESSDAAATSVNEPSEVS